MAHYTTLDTVKQKLRIADTSIDTELDIYIDEVDAYIDRKIRATTGNTNEYGYPIVLPLTDSTNPPITYDLKQIAADLVEGKFRLKTTNENTLWETADKELEEYLVNTFGWAESHNLRINPQLTLDPTAVSAGSTVSLSGTGWKPRGQLYVRMVAGNNTAQTMSTSPSIILTDDDGNWSGYTITIPTSATTSSYTILVHDKVNTVKRNIVVT